MNLPPALAGLPLKEQVEHLLWANTEMTSLPTDETAQQLCRAGLTPSEERVVALLVKRAGQALSRDVLLTALTWDKAGDAPCEKTIDVLVCRIRRKLREAAVPGEIRAVYGLGYRWISE